MISECEERVRVSVIMTTYNHEKYIAKAIESVLCQHTDFRFELLIGDDSSSDNTAQIAQIYMDKYPNIIRLFSREKNLGPTKNGFDLMSRATGEYIATCEGDDFWTDADKLQKQMDFMERHKDYSACTHEIVICDESGDVICDDPTIRWISSKREYSIKDFRGIFLPGHPVSLFRRNLMTDSSVDLSIMYKADSMISDRTIALIWASHGKIYRLPDKMAAYRVVRNKSAGNVTSQIYLHGNDIAAIQRDYEYTSRLMEYARGLSGDRIDFEYHLAELYASCIYRELRSGESTASLRKQISGSCRRRFFCVAMFPIIAFKRLLEKNNI